jgi:hypothetical protein
MGMLEERKLAFIMVMISLIHALVSLSRKDKDKALMVSFKELFTILIGH